MIGAVLADRYRVVRPFASGGMGVVYEAEHVVTGRRVALKVLHPKLLQEDPTYARRFEIEAQAAGALHSSHIAQVIDAGQDPATGSPFIAMELLSGESLSDLLKRTRTLAPDVALRIVVQACRGLTVAHEAGVIHRDIKPGNLFIARTDSGGLLVKLLDFGIAKVSTREGIKLTKTGNVIGTPAYMSPEQALGNRALDGRSDLWSVGVLLYKMLSGNTPYRARGPELIVAIARTDPPPIERAAPWVPAPVAAIVHRALRRNPDERFASAAIMREAALAALPQPDAHLTPDMLASYEDLRAQRAPVSASGSKTFVNTIDATTLETPSSPRHDGLASRSHHSSPKKSSGPLWLAVVALGGLAALAVAIGGWFLLRPSPEPQPAVEAGPPMVKLQTEPRADESPGPAIVTVSVDVAPADLAVEVDGVTQTPKQGTLQLTGPVGSTVTIAHGQGANAQEFSVALTDRGAIPDKISFDQTPTPTQATQPRAAARPAAASPPEPEPAPAPKPEPKPKKSGLSLSDEFE